MTDTSARDALAAALDVVIDGGWYYRDLYATRPQEDADAILANPFTPDQRRALATAFLDVETLAAAMYAAVNSDRRWDDESIEAQAADILAALRETP